MMQTDPQARRDSIQALWMSSIHTIWQISARKTRQS